MRTLVLSAAVAVAFTFNLSAQAQTSTKSLCSTCGVVQGVQSEKREGEGGAVGVVGGAVVGGLLGNQVGGGTGKTLATIGGAVGGAYLGNEVQKRATSKTVWISTVRMKDGSIRRVETATAPAWKAGQVVRAGTDGALVPLK